MFKHSKIFSLLLLVLVMRSSGKAEERRLELSQGDVVTFLGGTNLMQLLRDGTFETLLTLANADDVPRFRDLTWEADTVYRRGTELERWRPDGFGRFMDQLKRVKTTVVVIQFGQLESMQGTDSLGEFTSAYERLISELKKTYRRLVLVTPIRFEKPAISHVPDLSKHNQVLKQYVAATQKLAERHGLIFVNLFGDDALAAQRLTQNGMHVEPALQPRVAAAIAKQLGIPQIDVQNHAAMRAVKEKHRLWYDYWRPANWKLLYGDDSRRVFTRGGKDYIPFREEWQRLLPMIDRAEERIRLVAGGKGDPGEKRPEPEKLHGAPNADIAAELRAFSTREGLRVNLFASDKEGLTSPIAMRWDTAGRMYVAVTTTYPHVFPGDVPNDKIIRLEDTNADGVADKSIVFAEGLNIPTGIELGDGGVYVGQNTQLLFLKDTDDDGKADVRRVLLSGFGNGDSHQTINSFIWSPDGELYFGQGDGCESRVETPWGSSDLFQAGFYRLRPRRLQLHPLLDDFMVPGNPWGVVFDEWGQVFCVDGAGGVTYLSPGQIPSHHRRRIKRIGDPGGYCGVAYLDGRHLPDSLHGQFIVGDFKANRLKRFALKRQGAGFELEWKEPLLASKHRNFRPVDVKVGPDGAIYVVDWYNPITCHQDDAYRDPTRDKAHGRIWRLSSAAAPVRTPDLSKATLAELVKQLAMPEHFTRYQAKREMTNRDSHQVANQIDEWIVALDPKSQRYEHHLFEALSAVATLEQIRPKLLKRVLHSSDSRARAFAARMIGRWHDRLDNPLELLAIAVNDGEPQVRMEATIACAAVPNGEAMKLAATVLDKPMDYWIDYSLKQAVHQLRRHWLPQFQKGSLSFRSPGHVAFILNEARAKGVLRPLRELARKPNLAQKQRYAAISAILAIGEKEDLVEFGLKQQSFVIGGDYDTDAHASALLETVDAVRARKHKPEQLADLAKLIESKHAVIQSRAIALAGLWGLNEFSEQVSKLSRSQTAPLIVREAAFQALLDLRAKNAAATLARIAKADSHRDVRALAAATLVQIDANQAAGLAAALLSEKGEPIQTQRLLAAFLNQQGGASELSTKLGKTDLSSQTARQLMRDLFATGNADPALVETLKKAIGTTGRPPNFQESLLASITNRGLAKGDARRGAQVFKAAACNACHTVAGQGGKVGPDLTAIGTTLAPKRIVEELVWPNRQVKEGFSVVQVITDGGKVYHGYEQKTRPEHSAKFLTLRETATNKVVQIPRGEIDVAKVTGSQMPEGLTSLLSDQQLADLIRYLSDLGKLQ